MANVIQDVIDQALESDQVVDIFEATGLQRPDVSIFSQAFLDHIKQMEHPNLALATLQKRLHDEINDLSKDNHVQGQSLMESLTNIIRQYQNNVFTAAEAIQDFADLARKIKQEDTRAQELGLSHGAMALYDAIVLLHDSTKEKLGKDTLRALAVRLYKIVQNNPLDWHVKGSLQADFKIKVKKALVACEYPEAQRGQAVEAVFQQAKMWTKQHHAS